jgi:hypothetical protein
MSNGTQIDEALQNKQALVERKILDRIVESLARGFPNLRVRRAARLGASG